MSQLKIFRLESEAAFEKKQIFQGNGAMIVDGRWHSSPRQIIYCSSEISLAILEVRVHLSGVKTIPSKYLIEVDIKDDQIFENIHYPNNWRVSPPNYSTQHIGNNWYDEKRSLIFKVKSSIVPKAFNYLINCTHTDFNLLRPSIPRKYDLDPRLWI
jgi:RES domain-containing protein